MNDLYREIILDHYKHPRNYGELDHPDATFEKDNPLCGDEIRMNLSIKNDKKRRKLQNNLLTLGDNVLKLAPNLVVYFINLILT